MSGRSPASPREPSVFVSYRRADDPFAAALVAAALLDRFGARGVFLDTLALRPRSDPSRRLPQALAPQPGAASPDRSPLGSGNAAAPPARSTRLGPVGDHRSGSTRQDDYPRLPRQEHRAQRRGPPDLRGILSHQPSSVIRRTHLRTDITDLVDRIITVRDAPPARAPADRLALSEDLDPATIRTGIDAMRTGDWLRHLAPAALSQRPNGSAIVAVTETAVAIADLDHTFRITRQLRVESTELTSADLVPRRRLGLLATADIHLHTTTDPGVKLFGLFREPADELMENLRAMDGLPPTFRQPTVTG